jgi:hypothetical protein
MFIYLYSRSRLTVGQRAVAKQETKEFEPAPAAAPTASPVAVPVAGSAPAVTTSAAAVERILAAAAAL